MFQGIAFGTDESLWRAASPAHFDVDAISKRVAGGSAPRLVPLDRIFEDQLVPMNQMERIKARLEEVDDMRVLTGHRRTGEHAAPWKKTYMIWESVQDAIKNLEKSE